MPSFGTHMATLWPPGKPGKSDEQCGCGCGVIALVLLLFLVLAVAALAAVIVASLGAAGLAAPIPIVAPTLQLGAAVLGLFVLLVVAGILLLIAGLLLAWCLFRRLVRAVFGPVLTPMVASLRELGRILRGIADGVHTFAGGIDQAANTIGAVSIPIPNIPKTDDLWTLLLNVLGLGGGSSASPARVLTGDVTTTNLAPFGVVKTELQTAADLLDHATPPGVEQQLRGAADAIDAIATALETLFGP
jgi:hypothetical protein